MLRVELPQLAHRSEAHTPEETGSFVDTLISLLCGIVCNNEQYNKTVGKTNNISYHGIVLHRHAVTIMSQKHPFDHLSLLLTHEIHFSSTLVWWTDIVNVNISSLTS